MVTKEELDRYQKAYANGFPLITDEEYDTLLEEYLNVVGEKNRPFLRVQQSSEVNAVVGTLTKCYGVTVPMREGQKTYDGWVKTNKLSKGTLICLQPKFDGVSIAYDCVNDAYFTRGDYDDGESMDVTDLFNPNVHYPYYREEHGMLKYPTSLKYELIMSKERFVDSNFHNKYARPRDTVSGALMSRNTDTICLSKLQLLREYYEDARYYISNYLLKESIIIDCSDYDSIQNWIDRLLDNQASVNIIGKTFAVDGVVASVVKYDEEKQLYEVIGPEVAIKILNDIQQTKLKDIQYQFGVNGMITPVAIVEPVTFCDGRVTVTNITISNLNRVQSFGLRYNDTVSIVYNIVPYLLSTNSDGDLPIPLPTKCPICNYDFDMSTLKTIQCSNPNCDGLKLGAIIRYCTNMKMYGVAEGILSKLYDAGVVRNISDLYKMSIDDIINIDGFKDKSANNIINSIRTSSKDVPLERWLSSFQIVGISELTWKNILSNSLYKSKMDCNSFVKQFITDEESETKFIASFLYEAVKSLDGIGVITLNRIVKGIQMNWDMIHEVSKYVTFKNISSAMNSQNITRVSLTGTRDSNVIEYLTNKGYEVASFTKTTKILIIPDKDYVSNKVIEAKRNGIPIYTIEEVYQKL